MIYLYPSFENASGIKEQEKLLEICRKIFSNEKGSLLIAFVECALLTDCYGTAPYYVNNNMGNCVAFYQDGTMAVCSKSPIEMYRARTYATEFNRIIREIKDMGSQYNEVCYLK